MTARSEVLGFMLDHNDQAEALSYRLMDVPSDDESSLVVIYALALLLGSTLRVSCPDRLRMPTLEIIEQLIRGLADGSADAVVGMPDIAASRALQ